MTDWPEAGRKAWKTRQANDARRVFALYRAAFANPAKAVIRRRMIEVLRAAGGTTMLDLWGGGMSADAAVAAGLTVISVDDGSMKLPDGQKIGAIRKRRALELAATEGGYDGRWGSATAAAAECDVAMLDFCGPWSREVSRTVRACRHMKAIVVTLLSDHDINTEATTQQEREEMYRAALVLAFTDGNAAARRALPCRVLCRYRSASGHPVWVFLLAHERLPIRHLSSIERRVLGGEVERTKERERQRRRLEDPDVLARFRAYQATYRRERLRSDPLYAERQRAANRKSYAKRKAHRTSK